MDTADTADTGSASQLLQVWNAADYWRAITLYGLNTATYKIALAMCLTRFVEQGVTHVSMPQLSEAFFDLYSDRLAQNGGKPQLVTPHRQTVMERIVTLQRTGKVSRTQALEMVEQEAFRDVVPRFHTLGDQPTAVRFYEHTGTALIVTDAAFQALTAEHLPLLRQELDSRWGLLEAAFEMRRDSQDSALINDIRTFYLARGHERTSITHNEPVLNGYQNGVCFYCGESMTPDDRHVDHLIPRQLVYHDEVWNLVLAHGFCNLQKSDALPGEEYVRKLIARNEHFIESNHPIKNKLVAQMGNTARKRGEFVWKVYQDARLVLRYTWQGIRGYDPATDPFYRSVVRRLGK